MSTQNVVNVSVAPIEALLQRTTEDFATHVEFEGGDPDVVKSGQEIIEQTKERLTALRHEVEEIQVSPKWSDAHKTTLAIEAVGKADAGCEAVRKAARTKRDAADEAKTKLMAIPKAQTDPTTDFLSNAEIRQRLSLLPPSERMKLVAQAMASGRMQVIRAIQLDPFGEEFVPTEFLRRLQEEHAQQSEGQAWTRLKTLELVADRLSTVATALDLSLKGFGQIPSFQGQPTKTSDLKMQNPQQAPPKGAGDQPPAGVSSFP